MVSLQNTSWEKPAVLAYIGQTEFCYILMFWTTTVDVTKALTQGHQSLKMMLRGRLIIAVFILCLNVYKYKNSDEEKGIRFICPFSIYKAVLHQLSCFPL